MELSNVSPEMLGVVKDLMGAVGEQTKREETMPYLRRRKQPLNPDDLEWGPQPIVFRPEDFVRFAMRASVILVPERFVQHVRASEWICTHMNWNMYDPHAEMGLLGHFAGSPVYSDHLASEHSRNPKDKFLFVGANRNARNGSRS